LNISTSTKIDGVESSNAFIDHVGWLRHDYGEEVIHLLRQGHFEAAEQAFFWLYLRPDDTFIDCGAHIGLYSVLASKATAGGANIVAIEANPYTAQHLAFNLNSNNVTKATIVEAAIWDSLGEVSFLKNEKGEAAYDHIAFGNSSTGLTVTTITLNKLVENVGGSMVALVKLDVEGAEPEALVGGKDAIAAGMLPVLMVEFTENNLRYRGLDTGHLYKQLEELGYTLCELHPERLQLEPFQLDGPIWYKNLFACRDLALVNRRLESACNANRKIALDILARAKACSKFKYLENLETYMKQAEQSEKLRQWAEGSDAAITMERESSEHLRDWAQRIEALLLAEREESEKLRQWAERSDAAITMERESSEHLREVLNSRKKLLLRFFSRIKFNA
jgi:FkbM family methyltransferase